MSIFAVHCAAAGVAGAMATALRPPKADAPPDMPTQSCGHGTLARAARTALLLIAACTGGKTCPIFADDDQIFNSRRGELALRHAGERLQVVEWIGPGSTNLAWPIVSRRRYAVISARDVPTGLPQVGMIVAMAPTWGLNLRGVALNDEDLRFIVKRCRRLRFLSLVHPSVLPADEFGDFTDEERAAFQSRTLSGDALAGLAKLKRLQILEIAGYPLPATRLQFLSELEQLQYLTLTDMQITDEDLQSLRNLPKLMSINLSGTPVTGSGLRHLRDCRSLKSIILNRTAVTDDLAKHLKENPLPQVEWLYIRGCKITPAGLTALRSVVPLFGRVIETDEMHASLTPPDAQNAQEIRRYRSAYEILCRLRVARLHVEKNHVTAAQIHPAPMAPYADWVLPFLSPFKGLTHLRLDGCKVSADAFGQLQEHEHLEWLSLSKSSVDDEGLRNLGSLPHLKGINLADTQVTDAGLRSLSELRNLEWLDLGETKVTDRGIRAIRLLWRLKSLTLRKCQVTDAGAEQLAGMTNLEFLCLDQTQVTDRSVVLLAKLPRLKGLSLKHCQITETGAEKLLEAENLENYRLDGVSISELLHTKLKQHVSTVLGRTRGNVGLPPSPLTPLPQTDTTEDSSASSTE